MQRPISPIRFCWVECRDLLLHFFNISHIHSHSTRHKVYSPQIFGDSSWTTSSSSLCTLDSFHPSFPSPAQSPPVSKDFPLEKQFTCLSTVEKTFLKSQGKGYVPALATESYRFHFRPFLSKVVGKVRNMGLAARHAQRQITVNQDSWG